jgi:hypothetical protein
VSEKGSWRDGFPRRPAGRYALAGRGPFPAELARVESPRADLVPGPGGPHRPGAVARQ